MQAGSSKCMEAPNEAFTSCGLGISVEYFDFRTFSDPVRKENQKNCDADHGFFCAFSLHCKENTADLCRNMSGKERKVGMRKCTWKEAVALDLFSGLPRELLEEITKMGKCVEYRKKECVFRAGEKVRTVYVVMEGEVMLYNLTKHGNRKIIFFLGQGRLLNHNICNTRPVSVFCESVSPAVLLCIPLEVFQKCMEESAVLTKRVLCEYERYIWRLSHQLKNTAGNLLIERKIAAKLWKLGRDFGVSGPEGIKIDLELTMTVLADYVGVPRETVSRACQNLGKKGLLVYRNRRFLLPDPDGLAVFYKV